MREYKFRAKDRETGQWAHGSSEDFVSENANEIWLGEFWRNIETGILDAETCGQYTGLLDKNGKEIYEGDIVKTPAGSGQIWWNKCFYIVWGDGDGSTTLHDTLPEQMEAIGNIYENEDLLK